MFIVGAHSPISEGWPAIGLRAGVPQTPPARVSGSNLAGTAKVGETLTIAPLPVYSGVPEPTVSYRWQSRVPPDGALNTIQTGGTSLVLTEAHVGLLIRSQDMASNAAGSSSWSGNPWVGPVEPATEPEPEV